MIFVTLGSQKFPFDRLLQKLDEMVQNGTVREPVFAQTGASTYTPVHYEYAAFLDREAFGARMQEADLVITHAGTGAIIGGVKAGKKVIAVPRLARFGEHVDDHQVQIVDQFADMGIIQPCYDTQDLPLALEKAANTEFAPYVSNTKKLLQDLTDYLESVL